MNCFVHPSQPAVTMCSQCGKGACRTCATDVRGATLCNACVNLARAQVENEIAARAEAQAAEEYAVREAAGRRVRRANIIGIVGGIIFGPLAGISFSQELNSPFAGAGVVILVPLLIVMYTYIFGSMSLTLPLIWGWWWRTFRNLGCSFAGGCAFWVVVIATFFTIPLWLASVYAIFGGGVYEYIKARRLAGQPVQPTVPMPAA